MKYEINLLILVWFDVFYRFIFDPEGKSKSNKKFSFQGIQISYR